MISISYSIIKVPYFSEKLKLNPSPTSISHLFLVFRFPKCCDIENKKKYFLKYLSVLSLFLTRPIVINLPTKKRHTI